MNKKRTKIVATISDKNCEPGFISGFMRREWI